MKKTIGIVILMGVLVLAACSPAPAAMEQEMPVVEEAVMEEPMPVEDMQEGEMAEEAPMAEADAPVTEMEMPQSGYTEIDALAAQALMESTPNLVIIDVSPSYANGHLPGSINIPLSQLQGRLGELDPAQPHLVYCHGDSPAIAGAEMLVANGFSPVYRLLGNYAGWVAAGLPVEK
ncbi:MAG: rhodanese-like domain-containing protein [Anaerolineaceae bacterium]|jgi:rhodanese-related sulfurtransferase|nr:rhodanese-like domain-containing protein [Anaerolineaceae bacterium]